MHTLTEITHFITINITAYSWNNEVLKTVPYVHVVLTGAGPVGGRPRPGDPRCGMTGSPPCPRCWSPGATEVPSPAAPTSPAATCHWKSSLDEQHRISFLYYNTVIFKYSIHSHFLILNLKGYVMRDVFKLFLLTLKKVNPFLPTSSQPRVCPCASTVGWQATPAPAPRHSPALSSHAATTILWKKTGHYMVTLILCSY